MKKNLFSMFLVFLAAETFAPAKINIGILRGMEAVPFAFMYSDNLKINSEKSSGISSENDSETSPEESELEKNSSSQKYSFTFFSKPFDLFYKMKHGFIDAAIISSESAEKLAESSGGQVRVMAVVSDIDFKIVSRRKSKVSFSDLIGNKIYVAGEGFAEHLLVNLLEKNSIPVEEGSAGVEIVLKNSQAELVSEFVQKKADYVLVSEPAVSDIFNRTKNARVAMELQEQCEAVFGYGRIIPGSVLVVRSDLAENSAKSAQQLLSDLEYSVQRVSKMPRKAAEIAAENNFGVSKRICAQAIAGTKYNFYPVKGDFNLIVNQ